jgi:hypothetical protein
MHLPSVPFRKANALDIDEDGLFDDLEEPVISVPTATVSPNFAKNPAEELQVKVVKSLFSIAPPEEQVLPHFQASLMQCPFCQTVFRSIVAGKFGYCPVCCAKSPDTTPHTAVDSKPVVPRLSRSGVIVSKADDMGSRRYSFRRASKTRRYILLMTVSLLIFVFVVFWIIEWLGSSLSPIVENERLPTGKQTAETFQIVADCSGVVLIRLVRTDKVSLTPSRV